MGSKQAKHVDVNQDSMILPMAGLPDASMMGGYSGYPGYFGMQGMQYPGLTNLSMPQGPPALQLLQDMNRPMYHQSMSTMAQHPALNTPYDWYKPNMVAMKPQVNPLGMRSTYTERYPTPPVPQDIYSTMYRYPSAPTPMPQSLSPPPMYQQPPLPPPTPHPTMHHMLAPPPPTPHPQQPQYLAPVTFQHHPHCVNNPSRQNSSTSASSSSKSSSSFSSVN